MIVCILVWQNTIFALTPLTDSTTPTDLTYVTASKKIVAQKVDNGGIKFANMSRTAYKYVL